MALKKIGALWTKKGKNEKQFLSGMIEQDLKGGSKIMLFKNKEKKTDKHPDFTVNLIQDDPQSAS